MSRWTRTARAAALDRLAGLCEREVPWSTGLAVLAEEHGAQRVQAAIHGQAEGLHPAKVLELAGLLGPEERVVVERHEGALADTLRLLARDARDGAAIREALRAALLVPCLRLFAVCLGVVGLWVIESLSVDSVAGHGRRWVAYVASILLGGMWVAPLLALGAAWSIAGLRSLIERGLRVLPMVGSVLELYGAARFWQLLSLGLQLERPLPEVLRAVRAGFPRGSMGYLEVDSMLPQAEQGRDLPGLLSYLDDPGFREDAIVRVAQERGSLAADVQALADLRREQLLDEAHVKGAALLMFADAALMLATAALLIGGVFNFANFGRGVGFYF